MTRTCSGTKLINCRSSASSCLSFCCAIFAAVTSLTAPMNSRSPESSLRRWAMTCRYLILLSGISNRYSISKSFPFWVARSITCRTKALSSGCTRCDYEFYGRFRCRVVFKNPERFLRPEDFPCGHDPAETAGVTQALGFRAGKFHFRRDRDREGCSRVTWPLATPARSGLSTERV